MELFPYFYFLVNFLRVFFGFFIFYGVFCCGLYYGMFRRGYDVIFSGYLSYPLFWGRFSMGFFFVDFSTGFFSR